MNDINRPLVEAMDRLMAHPTPRISTPATQEAVREGQMEQFRVQVLADAVDAVFRGERFPAKGFPAIDLADFLDQHVSVSEQTDAFCKLIVADGRDELADVMFDIRIRYERLLRAHLCGSEIVENVAQALRDDEIRMDEEDARHG